MAFNATEAERARNIQAEDAQKRSLEVPVARDFRQLFRQMGRDVGDLYALTGRGLDAEAYTDDVRSILRPAYTKSTRLFGNDIADHLEAEKDNTEEALVGALFLAAARNNTTFDEELAAYEGLKNQELRQFVNTSVPLSTQEITRTNQNNINRSIAQALSMSDQADETLTQGAIGAIAAAHFTSTNLFRGDMIAETEILNAAEGAKQISTESFMTAAGNQADLQAQKVWITQGDEKVRPSHVTADFQSQDIETPFEVGGARLRFPGDKSLGAPAREIINCRCNSQQSIDVAGTPRT